MKAQPRSLACAMNGLIFLPLLWRVVAEGAPVHSAGYAAGTGPACSAGRSDMACFPGTPAMDDVSMLQHPVKTEAKSMTGLELTSEDLKESTSRSGASRRQPAPEPIQEPVEEPRRISEPVSVPVVCFISIVLLLAGYMFRASQGRAKKPDSALPVKANESADMENAPEEKRDAADTGSPVEAGEENDKLYVSSGSSAGSSTGSCAEPEPECGMLVEDEAADMGTDEGCKLDFACKTGRGP
mmetsp:Transcript_23971/g.66639  ORF Transcript_23971/g.66639 Transcript_23971/m.66639 type:complete len:241 (-) Transcript_23971:120-842(-)